MQLFLALERMRRVSAIIFLLFFTALPMHAAPPPTPLYDGSNVYVESEITAFPDLNFVNGKNDTVFLHDTNGKLRIVNMWATWCGPCISEMPQLVALQREYADILTVIAVSEDRDGWSKIASFVTKHNLSSLTHYWDKGGAAFNAMQMKGLPISFLLDEQNRLIATVQGATDWQDPAFIALLKQHSP